jgi:hypothetical protein
MVQVVAIEPGVSPLDLARSLVPEVAGSLPRAERVAILRHLQRLSARSKATRLARQIGESGKWIWQHLRRPKAGASGRPSHEPERTTKF